MRPQRAGLQQWWLRGSDAVALACCQTFFINQEVADFYRIDSILCLVDAKHVREHLQARDAAWPCRGAGVDGVDTHRRR